MFETYQKPGLRKQRNVEVLPVAYCVFYNSFMSPT